ncbi:hypothetical protein [Aquibacillus rhizosphaerae]|uniref:DUF4064 domain-containing protein n=1 Tax=Aquibacillus rhizosphaerae TaxID=3051431 RepID=A0ABT7LBF5_9BACI|nr:hypothetical protein [Aquibacillus sp. LR5S19]MDL4843195.1 hypothetical protein [Aquibacillus sp. LR5S19]
MKHTTEFILGLIGSVLGILFTIIWFFAGIEFWATFSSGFLGEPDNIVSDEAYGIGLIITLFQVFILSAVYIVSCIFSIPSFLEKSSKRSGIILLIGGILALIVNVASLIPSALLIIAGGLCFRKAPAESVKETA